MFSFAHVSKDNYSGENEYKHVYIALGLQVNPLLPQYMQKYY